MALGDTPRVADELCAMAAPDTVLMSADLAEAAISRFIIEPTEGMYAVLAEGQRASAVKRLISQHAAPSEPGVQAQGSVLSHTLMGREREVAALVKMVTASHGGTVAAHESAAGCLLTAGAGAGKSALLSTVIERVRATHGSHLRTLVAQSSQVLKNAEPLQTAKQVSKPNPETTWPP